MIGSMTSDIVDQRSSRLRSFWSRTSSWSALRGCWGQLTVLETSLDAEMSEHLGYEKHDPEGRNSGNSRNGTRAKTVLTEIGPVEIEVPRDTTSRFSRRTSSKARARADRANDIVLSLTARGLTTGKSWRISRGCMAPGSPRGRSAGSPKGHRRDDRVAEQALGEGLPGDLHRRDGRQGPRWTGSEQARLGRDSCDRGLWT